ncbi:alkaline phosphatase family protein [Empedobacter stercoris]|uniref:alkaline phosphatase family protein n=1 Tax=Empedobacter stercoris TaxID=1628248 RepID=UPI001CE17C89|nr:alkaline phosphatase family protein [Empedobacter stercoris]MCA4782924.1 alkaline phosphatase family protein [Empedobacter stercoris]
MKYTVLILAFFSNLIFAQEPKVIVITMDGVRWKEVFRGADKYLINRPNFTSSMNYHKEKYFVEDSLQRRKLLMPFTWNYIVKKGVILGNRDEKNHVNFTNKPLWSYPGYNEIITGKPDDINIINNDDILNPNISVFEIANQEKNFIDRVMVFGSWRMYPFIFNQERSKLKVNAGYADSFNTTKSEREILIERFQSETPKQWWGTRFDIFTHEFALEALKNQKPKLLFIGYGEADDYGHNADYDLYLNAINRNDRMIEELWNYVQTDPFYKDQTTIIVTTDHGRGDFYEWVDHSKHVKGSSNSFIMLLGPSIKKENFTKKDYYSTQIAQTIADLLEIKWHNPDAGKSLFN